MTIPHDDDFLIEEDELVVPFEDEAFFEADEAQEERDYEFCANPYARQGGLLDELRMAERTLNLS